LVPLAILLHIISLVQLGRTNAASTLASNFGASTSADRAVSPTLT